MGLLAVEHAHAGYDGGTDDVLRDVSITVDAGEIVALLGPSGSGKSTLLRAIAGLHPLRSGRILLDGVDAAHTPVESRGVGLVFQDHALFPHRDVAGNVAFGPRMQGLTPADIERRVHAALEQVGLAPLRDRAVDELSGGEQQRVALARALAARPRLLLLDEPYGSLDRPLRERLLAELPGLIATSGAGALLVTHDQQEALSVADRIAVIIGGRLLASGTPAELWRDPGDAQVASFLGVGPLVPITVSAGMADSALGRLPTPKAPDGPALLLLPRVALQLSTADGVIASATAPERERRHGDDGGDDGDLVAFRAEVRAVRFAGDHHVVTLMLPGGSETTLRRPGMPEDVMLAPGATVTVTAAAAALRVLPATKTGPAHTG